jgi:hypothetical protein
MIKLISFILVSIIRISIISILSVVLFKGCDTDPIIVYVEPEYFIIWVSIVACAVTFVAITEWKRFKKKEG